MNRYDRKKNKMVTTQKKNTAEVNEFVVSTLDLVQKYISQGFTHENFIRISRLLNTIHKYLKKDEIQLLEEKWRDSYTDSCDETELIEKISEIRFRFEA